jgi:hypothetical protein
LVEYVFNHCINLFIFRFFKKVSRAPRAASTSAIRRRPHKKQALSYSTLAYPSQQYGTRPAILGAEVAPVSMLRMLSSDSGTTAEEDQVDRILDTGAKKLFDSEEGRERLRDGSFNIDETAKTMLEAAKEALEEGDGDECAEDSKKATVRNTFGKKEEKKEAVLVVPEINDYRYLNYAGSCGRD